MGLPRLLGPALLTLVLYLWSAYRGVPRTARRDARWIWEILLLAALGLARRGLEPARAGRGRCGSTRAAPGARAADAAEPR